MSDRKLSVKKERVAELTTDDLHQVAGGAPQTYYVRECLHSVALGCTTAHTCPRPDEA